MQGAHHARRASELKAWRRLVGSIARASPQRPRRKRIPSAIIGGKRNARTACAPSAPTPAPAGTAEQGEAGRLQVAAPASTTASLADKPVEQEGAPARAPLAAGAQEDASAAVTEPARSEGSDGLAGNSEQFREEGPVHRRLIRATLPRPEGQAPVRPAPEFTIRQPGGRNGKIWTGDPRNQFRGRPQSGRSGVRHSGGRPVGVGRSASGKPVPFTHRVGEKPHDRSQSHARHGRPAVHLHRGKKRSK